MHPKGGREGCIGNKWVNSEVNTTNEIIKNEKRGKSKSKNMIYS